MSLLKTAAGRKCETAQSHNRMWWSRIRKAIMEAKSRRAPPHERRVQGPSQALGCPAQGSIARRRSSYNLWLWKPAEVAAEWEGELWELETVSLKGPTLGLTHWHTRSLWTPVLQQLLRGCQGHTGRPWVVRLQSESWRGDFLPDRGNSGSSGGTQATAELSLQLDPF